MNKTAIKNFAIWARNKLIADISYRAGLMGITADGIHVALPQSTGQTEFYDIGTAEPYAIAGGAIHQRRHLVELIQRKEKDTDYKTAYKYIIEEVAYTWFNRLIAVRFMEVNDYLPSHIRVLSSDFGKLEPDLVTTPFDAELEFSNAEQQTIIDLKNANKLDEVFRLLFIKQCNALNEILPTLFEKTNDYTEILLNLSVIDQDGVVYRLVHDIPEEDFDVQRGGQIEIIGWLYQYYNTEPKNEAFAKKGKITKEEIPAVTQLFTPDWIVRYMVENSVGRLWIEHLRALNEYADEAALAADFGWKYYLPEVEQAPEVEEKLRILRKERASLTPEQITMIDPCMGSGHILVYGFSVLMQIYENAGYGRRDAAKSILEHNLFGLDIDDRAYQMSYFAVMMKAREYNRRILNGENCCKLYAIQESNGITDAALGDMGECLAESERRKALKEIKALIVEFNNAKEYGSILNVEKRDWKLLRRFAVPNVNEGQLSLDMNGAEAAADKLQELTNIAEIMASQYLVTVTNPPYMAISNGTPNLINYVKAKYQNSKSDLFSVFIERCGEFVKNNGYQSLITMHSWMFLTSFENLRKKLQEQTIINMVHLGARAFEEISGEVVQTTSFIMSKQKMTPYKGCYCRLVHYATQQSKEKAFLSGANRYFVSQKAFDVIPGTLIAYWLSSAVFADFSKGKNLNSVSAVRKGYTSSNNEKYLRLWFEVSSRKYTRSADNQIQKWFPTHKGGSFRKWYGNDENIVNWENDGMEMKNFPAAVIRNEDYYFKECITWNDISTASACFRFVDKGSISNASGPSIFETDCSLLYLLALGNSKVADVFFKLLCPTIHFEVGQVSNLPVLIDDRYEKKVVIIADKCIEISKDDWASFETSIQFNKHPLLGGTAVGRLIVDKYKEWERDCEERFIQLKQNEEELNKIFIEIYGMKDELTPEVNEKDVTVRKADLQREIKSLLSYAVGCMFGRYSLDTEGLAYAGGVWDESKYKSYIPDDDNIIPITDEEYLEDDIVARLCSWLKVVYGSDTLEENLDFIANVLGNKGNSSREIIRNYFLNDFFKDHCQTYSVTGSGKRPIYWLFDSGKQNGFKALIYLHRYSADTMGNLRIDYLHRMQRVYEGEIGRMQDMIDHSTNAREVGQATKRREKIQKQLKECRDYDEKLAHLALSRVELDLDEGVKKNYRKIQTAIDGKLYEVLADSKNIMAKEK